MNSARMKIALELALDRCAALEKRVEALEQENDRLGWDLQSAEFRADAYQMMADGKTVGMDVHGNLYDLTPTNDAGDDRDPGDEHREAA